MLPRQSAFNIRAEQQPISANPCAERRLQLWGFRQGASPDQGWHNCNRGGRLEVREGLVDYAER